MPSKKLYRQYPYLAEYLSQHESNPIKQQSDQIWAVGGAITAFSSILITFAVIFASIAIFKNPIITLAATIITAVTAFTFGILQTKKRAQAESKPKNSHEQTLLTAHEAGIYFRKLDNEKKLHRWLDPVAAQLLEAGSYHWHRAQETLRKPTWQHSELPQHWISLKERAQDASDLAMAELITLCSGCVGEPKKSRKDDIEGIFEDFGDLDIQDALQGLKAVITTSSQDYTFHSPEARTIFEPGRKLAERLKDLAEELESAETRIKAETLPIPDEANAQGAETIDHLLGEFRAVRQAEEELHQSDRA